MNQRHAFIAAAVTLVCLIALTSPARADILNYGTSIANVFNDSVCASGSHSGNQSLICSSSGVTVTDTLNPVVSVSVVAHPNISGMGGFGSVFYDFSVMGGNWGDYVTLDIAANLFTSPTGINDGDGAMVLVEDNSNIYVDQQVMLGGSWSGTVSFTVLTDRVYRVYVEAGASADGVSGSSAYADPHIFVDPTFAQNNPGYWLDFGNAGNTEGNFGSTPEPSSLMLLGSGIAGLAGVLRRKINL